LRALFFLGLLSLALTLSQLLLAESVHSTTHRFRTLSFLRLLRLLVLPFSSQVACFLQVLKTWRFKISGSSKLQGLPFLLTVREQPIQIVILHPFIKDVLSS
jgi:hypothetical protein